MILTHGNIYSNYIIESLPDFHLLKALGLRRGTEFMIHSKQPFRGAIVVKVGSRSIAIDYDIAKEIIVKEVIKN